MRINLAALARGFFVAAFAVTATTASAATYMYVGNAASNEIVTLTLDPKTGELKEIDRLTVPGITKGAARSQCRSRRTSASSMRASAASHSPRRPLRSMPRPESLSTSATGRSRTMAYITTDRTGKWLLSASYPGTW